jgi:metal-dependent hydrolase (beta-lactamase superfamily II)
MAPEDTPWSPRGDRISHRLSPEEEAAEAAAAAKKAKEGEADAINEDEAWILNRKKSLVMHSGCDPANSERIGLLTNKMPVRILELRTVRLRSLIALDCP